MISTTDVDGVAIVRLEHGKVNALDLELVTAIAATFRGLATSAHRAIVFSGAGPAFSAGVDLQRIADGGGAYVRAFLPALVEAFEAVFTVPKPVVVAVNGHAIAGGCVLVAAGDHRLMSAGRIGLTELLVGVPFPAAALEIMRYATGAQRTRQLILTGATHEPSAALGLGLVDEVVAPQSLPDAAIAAADRLASAYPADTFALTKAQLRRDALDRIHDLGRNFDEAATRIWEKRATDGGIAAFMESLARQRRP